MIDSSPVLTKHPGQSHTIESPGPGKMADGVVLLRPLLFQQRLGLRIVLLLPPVGAHRVAAVMPHHRRSGETQGPAALLQPPADIDIVASKTETRIETTHRFWVGFTKSHATASNGL